MKELHAAPLGAPNGREHDRCGTCWCKPRKVGNTWVHKNPWQPSILKDKLLRKIDECEHEQKGDKND